MSTVIGLTGLKGAGKDEAAKALVADGWKRLALADPLRQMLYVLNPIVRPGPPPGRAFAPLDQDVTHWQEYIDGVGYERAKQTTEVRRLMQVFGTEVVRAFFGDNAWVDLAVRTIESEPWTQWVVTDVRFDNEATMIHDLGGFVVRIERDGLTADGHASEAGVRDDLLDLQIPNNGSVEDLHERTRGAVAILGQLRRLA